MLLNKLRSNFGKKEEKKLTIESFDDSPLDQKKKAKKTKVKKKKG